MCIVAVDYDGTITADFPAARKALQGLRGQGHTIVIWSSRNNPRQHGDNCAALMEEMLRALEEHKIPFDEIDDGTVGKFHAQVYIDDKAIRLEYGDWNGVIARIW